MAQKMWLRSVEREEVPLQQHQRQPQREQHAHDDRGDEPHAPEGLALNVGGRRFERHEAGALRRLVGRRVSMASIGAPSGHLP